MNYLRKIVHLKQCIILCGPWDLKRMIKVAIMLILKFMLAVAVKGYESSTVPFWPQLVKEMFINTVKVI